MKIKFKKEIRNIAPPPKKRIKPNKTGSQSKVRPAKMRRSQFFGFPFKRDKTVLKMPGRLPGGGLPMMLAPDSPYRQLLLAPPPPTKEDLEKNAEPWSEDEPEPGENSKKVGFQNYF